MLDAQNISHSSLEKKILNNFSLRVNPRQCTAIFGKSGAGKTTLLRILCGLEAPDVGIVRWENTLLTENKMIVVPPEKRGFGMVFQDAALFPHLDVVGNVEFGIHTLPRTERRTKALEWLSQLGVQHLAHRSILRLSGGERQRVALARALAPNPRALLLDEPFSSVDRMARKELIAALKEVLPLSNTATILVTHDERDAVELATDTLVLK
jgi:iron(III) transport system ATP-binding protein